MRAERRLILEARHAMKRAYSPFSKINVGCCVLTDDNKTFSGCNIENSSYGLSVCAERVAVFKAVSENHRRIKALALTSNSDKTLFPCGACLQVISEFAVNKMIPIIVVPKKDKLIRLRLNELLPWAGMVYSAVHDKASQRQRQ